MAYIYRYGLVGQRIDYGTFHKKLYEIHRFAAWVILSLCAELSRIFVKSSKGIRGIVKGHPRNCQRVSADL